MARPYSLAHLTVLGCPPPEAIHIAARCGYDMVGLRAIPLGLEGEPRYRLDEDAALFSATREALDATGLTLLDIEVAVLGDDRDPAAYLAPMQAAAELGARHVLCNAWSGDRATIQGQFDALCDLAAPLGLTIECEFVTFTKIVDLTDAWDVVQRSGRPNTGVLVDTLHFGRSGVTLAQLDAIPIEKLHYLQLGDGAYAATHTADEMRRTARAERLYPGEGPTPIRQIVERVPGVPLSVEIIHAKRVGALGYEGFAQQCLDRTKAYLEGPGDEPSSTQDRLP
jgi:sugar phosphate isomerase/epimerase